MNEKRIEYSSELYLAYRSFAEAGAAGLKLFPPRPAVSEPFSNQAALEDNLLEEHRRLTARLCRKLEGCQSYIPDLFQVLSQYPTELRFHRRLLLGRRDDQADRLYRELNKRINAIIYPLWAEQVRYTGEPGYGKKLHLSLMDLWLLHLDLFNLSVNVLIEKAEHINLWLMCFRDEDMVLT